ncbi:hypothetical protein G5714_005394 [Onychostoma macrolepis]|uniref:Uncharacterized protein n=1 Tax=Onychostoma macrolepis TaxID=369639 RepID=A0A7J6D0X0_9TELE|nr:hypothetical protein G5714_005394 [Onychostoma macrolepis]
MYRNTLIFLILLDLVVFSTNTKTTVEPFSETTEKTPGSTENDSTHTSLSSSSTSMDLATTQDQPNSTVSEPTEEPQGLTSGQIAGIAVGSIAGVAALGGGIYAGLKYTGKLGG